MLRRIFAAVVFTVAVGATAAAQDVKLPEIEFGRYHALVIGNNDYQHLRNLTTAVGDAEAVATLLEEKYGFRVTKLTNATRLDITGAFNRLRQKLTEKDNLLVYYAGHGVLDEEAGAGYWQPVDARPDDDSNWFSNTRLTRYLKAMSAQHVMVVADSCYSGNLTRVGTSTVRSGSERDAWMQRMNQKRSRTALTSGGLEPVLDQGGGGHSVFARAFLSALQENPDVLFGEELFDRLKGQVVANADQTPEYSDIRYTGHEKGDFLFVPLNLSVAVTVKPAPAPAPAPRPDTSAFELTFWNSIKDSDRPRDFEEYLKQFPKGVFSGLARSRIEALKQQQTAVVVPPKPEIEIDPIEAEYVAVKNANVRAEPTVRSAKVTTLKRGTEVHVAGKVKDRNWYLVERDDKPLGYVYGELLKDAETVRQEEEARRKEAQRKRAEEAKRREEERKRAEEAKQREAERKRAEEAKQREAERKRAEQSKLALAPIPKVPVKPRHPYDGKYVGRVRREWYKDPNANCPHMRMEITVTDGIIKGVATTGKFSVSTEERNKSYHMEIIGHVDERGRSVGVTAKFFWRGLNFSSVEFFGNLEKGEWREVSGVCGGVYELRKVE